MLADICKAFDSVNLTILITKLNNYGFRGQSIDLLKSYLLNRFQYVSLQNTKSTPAPVTHGVPQGSILGPLLFLIYINDIYNATLDSVPILFADDNTITVSAPSLIDLETNVNHCLLSLQDWTAANYLTLNFKKTCVLIFHNHKNCGTKLRFSLGNTAIAQVSQALVLGIIVDENLTFNPQVESVRKKLSSSLLSSPNCAP